MTPTSAAKTCLPAAHAIFAIAIAVSAAGPDLDRATELYRQTQYQQALRLLEASPDRTAPALALLGKCYYMLDEFKQATEALEKAVAADPRNSDYLDWLGKAFGRRAETSSFFTAPSYAVKARKSFEQAVQQDPNNLEAVDDLFEYYLEAPGFLGGGMDKAANLAGQIRDRQPAKYHSLLARWSGKKKLFPEEEEHLRRAAGLAPAEPGRWIALAQFLARHNRHSESDEAFERAGKVAPDSPKLKFERARTYIQSGRNREQARQLLQEYLNSPLTPEDPPRAEATRLLRTLATG